MPHKNPDAPKSPPKEASPARRRWAMLRYPLLVAAAWLVLAGGLMLFHWTEELPDTAGLMLASPSRDVTFLDVKGRPIGRRGLTQGEFITAVELPSYVMNAFIAIEDRRFREHFGLDPIGVIRATMVNVSQHAYVQGGSTITQQLAKNLFLKPDRTMKRKVQEALLAVWLESRYSKNEILTLYLNRVYFGAGVYGIEAASERFFGKHASALTISEAAILAGSVKAPSNYNPAVDPDAAFGRAGVVLRAMEDAGFIDSTTMRQAMATRVKVTRGAATPGAGYFLDYTMSLLAGYVGDAKERLIVDTTLDLDLQTAAEHAVETGLSGEGITLKASEAALVTMTLDGAVRTLVGGKSYAASPFNRAVDALRQPGSSFKAFVFLTALERGHKPDDEMDDGPVTIGKWKPDNYEGRYEGKITLARALARSSNSVSVQLTREAGAAAVAATARRLGITSTLHAVPALALGTSEVTPLEMTAGYTAFANGGSGVSPYPIVRIRTESGKVIYQRKGLGGAGRVMSEADAATMTHMFENTVATGTGKAAQLSDRATAGKTGTSQDYRDAWFIGFTADYVCAVWIGNDNNTPMNKATGGGLPARIFKGMMAKAEDGLPSRPLAAYAYESHVVEQEQISDEAGAMPPEDKKESNQNVLDTFQTVLDSLF